MKKIFVLVTAAAVIFCACANKSGEGANTVTSSMAKEVSLTGVIIDNACADANAAKLPDFIKTHTKECALMPNCAASGYSIYMGGKLQKFDKDSSKKIEQFLKDPKSTLKVNITAKDTNGVLELVKIENQ